MNSTIPGSAAFQALFPDIKIVTGYEIGEKAVTGWCEIYKQRTDKENEFAIREIGVAFFQSGKLDGKMVAQAIESARAAALDTLAKLLDMAAPPAGIPSPYGEAVPVAAPTPPREEPAGVSQELDAPDEQDTAPLAPKTPAESSIREDAAEEMSEASPPEQQADTQGAESGSTPPQDNIKRVEFTAELFPASNLMQNSLPAPPEPEQQEEPDAQPVQEEPPKTTASADSGATPEKPNPADAIRQTVITICGKAHACYGWTAEKIVDKQPEAIINMFQRMGNGKYTGDKVDQMTAIEALYPEALRKMQSVAA